MVYSFDCIWFFHNCVILLKTRTSKGLCDARIFFFRPSVGDITGNGRY